MATPKDFYVPIDMHGLEILNHRLHVLGSDPGSPNDGEIWFNSTVDEPRVRATRGSTGANRALIADDDDFQARLNIVTTIDDADMVLIYDDSVSAVDHQGKYRQITKANFVSGLSTVLNSYYRVTVDSGITNLDASGSSALVLTGDAGGITTFVGTAPVTNTATLTYANQTANLVFSGPSSGGAAAPTFRALVDLDMPATYDPTNWDTAYSHSGITGTNPHGVDMNDLGYGVVTTLGDPGTNANLVTEAAIRSAIGSAISGGVTYKGGYNAATNTPNLDVTPIAGILTGDMYIVTVAGDFFTDTVDVGDMLIAIQDTPTLLAHWTVIAREWDETFLELGDTPASYAASGGFMTMVNTGVTALEFIDPSGYALSNFNDDLDYMYWGTATNEYVVLGSSTGDVASSAQLAYNTTSHVLTIDSATTASSKLELQYNSISSIYIEAISATRADFVWPTASVIYFYPETGNNGHMAIGNYHDVNTFFGVKDTNSAKSQWTFAAFDNTNNVILGVQQVGTVYMTQVAIDNAETYMLMIDSTTGELSRRAVTTLPVTGGDVSWGTETGVQPIVFGASAGDIDSSSLLSWDTSTSTLALKTGTTTMTSLATGTVGLFHIAEGAYAAIQLNTYSNVALYAASHSVYRYGGTISAPAAAPTDAMTYQDFYNVWDGTGFRIAGYFAHMIDGAVATDDFDTKFEWALKEGAALYTLMVTLGVNGFEYAADHSTDQAANNRWIPDKEYVDGIVSGYVTAVPTPVNNQVALWTGATSIDGNANFTFSVTTLGLNGTSTNTISSAGVLFIESSHASPQIGMGDFAASGVYLTIRESTFAGTSTMRVIDAANNTILDLREDQTIYMPGLGSDEAEAYVVAIDDTTGLLTKRSVGSIAATPGAHAASHISTGGDSIATFSTSSVATGLVTGSNSVGATYYLDGNGAWSVPVGSGDVSWGSLTTNQPVVFGTNAGDIDSETTLTYNPSNYTLSLDSLSLATAIIQASYNSTEIISIRATSLGGTLNGTNILFIYPTGVGSRMALGDGADPDVFVLVHDSNTAPLTSVFKITDDASASLFDVRQNGTMYIAGLGDNDSEDHVLAVNDSTGLITKRAVSTITGTSTFIGLTDVPASYVAADAYKFVAVNATFDGLAFFNIIDFTPITDIADTDELIVGLAAGGTRAVTWANFKTEIWEDHGITNHSDVTITTPADNHLLVYDTGVLVNKKAKHVEVINGNDVLTDFAVNHALGTEDYVVQVWSELGDDVVTPSITRGTTTEATTHVYIGFSTAPATGTNYKVVVIGFEG